MVIMSINKASIEFNKILLGYLYTWTMIDSFIQMVNSGLPFAKERERQDSIEVLAMFQFINNTPEEVAEMYADRQVYQAKTATLAAGIIYAHSALDSLITGLCHVMSLQHQERWDDIVGSKQPKFSVDQLKQMTYEDIRNQVITDTLKKLERESLLKRIDFIFNLCKSSAPMIYSEYTFDKEKLKDFDKLRIEIVHYDIPTDLESKFNDMMEFGKRTGSFFCNMVEESYDVCMADDEQLKLQMQMGKPHEFYIKCN
jgi:hypothetical protein